MNAYGRPRLGKDAIWHENHLIMILLKLLFALALLTGFQFNSISVAMNKTPVTMEKEYMLICYDEPASLWTEALPAGKKLPVSVEKPLSFSENNTGTGNSYTNWTPLPPFAFSEISPDDIDDYS